jgi:Tfp pilus assembly protein PilX
MDKQMKRSEYSNERGAALVTAIFAILLGTLLAVAIYYATMTTMTISINDQETTEVLYLADAGISHAVALINKLRKDQYSTVLTNGANTTPGTGDELSGPPVTDAWTIAESIPAGDITSGGVSLGTGRYFVSVRNDAASGETATTDTNGILVITSTGIGRDGAASSIEVIVQNGTTKTSYPGFLANGLVKVSNVTKIIGPNATMQINDVLDTSSNLCSEQQIQITSSTVPNMGKITTGPLCDQAGVLGSSVLLSRPRINPPIIDIARLRSDFRSKADFVFKPGAIYRQTNGVLDSFAMNDAEKAAVGFEHWDWSSSANKWSYSSGTALTDGTYYFENVDMKISNGGDPVTPPKITFFNEGSIEITNGPAFQPHLPGYAMISANDIRVSSKLGILGNPGLVYAYGHVEFTNQTDIVGSIIVANYYRSDGTNGPDALDFGGNNQVDRDSKGTVRFSNKVNIITANDVGNTGSGNEVTVLSWREIRK